MHVLINFQVKSRARHEIYRSAPSIVESVMSELVEMRAPEGSRPNPNYLARAVNRERQLTRPDEPKDLNFQVG